MTYPLVGSFSSADAEAAFWSMYSMLSKPHDDAKVVSEKDGGSETSAAKADVGVDVVNN